MVQNWAVVLGQDDGHFVQGLIGDGADFLLQAVLRRMFQRGKVEVFQKPLVQLDLQFLQTLFALFLFVRGHRPGRRAGGRGRGGAERCYAAAVERANMNGRDRLRMLRAGRSFGVLAESGARQCRDLGREIG